MSKFKKKKDGGIPPVSTAALPDIVFMLLFFFMVITVLKKDDLFVKQSMPKGDQVEKLKKDRSVYIYAGKPSPRYQNKFGTEGKIQIGDKLTDITDLSYAISAERQKLRADLQDKVMVALKVDGEVNSGLVSDIKQELRDLQMYKIIYITSPGTELDN